MVRGTVRQVYKACPMYKCHAIYTIHSATESSSRNVKTSKRCSYVRYNNHPMSRMHSACGNLLMKIMRSSKGSSFLLPFSTYCYHNPILCLQELLNRHCIVDLCEQWRNRIVESNILCDIFDGQMWQHFQYDCDGKPFLAEPMNYLLLLNCDWFQLFKHTQYSVGVLYVALGNLPRQIHFRRENILVLGIIPGPTEPSKNINSYLDPLVSDLILLWTGVNIKINGKPTTIRAAISCLACDVPAARKVGGFVGHNANKGYNKCLKNFQWRLLEKTLITLDLRRVNGNHVVMVFMYGTQTSKNVLKQRKRGKVLKAFMELVIHHYMHCLIIMQFLHVS